MEYDDLLELKKDVDELALYYNALKNKSKDIDEKFYSNNLDIYDNDEEDVLDYDEDEIDDLIRKQEQSFTLKKIVGYWARYLSIFVSKNMLDLPSELFSIAIAINLGYYCYQILYSRRILRKKILKRRNEDKIDIEKLVEDKKKIDYQLEVVRKKYYETSAKYERLVSELTESEYEEYLEYMSEYLQFILENSSEVLEDSISDLENVDFETMEEELEETKPHTYRLN